MTIYQEKYGFVYIWFDRKHKRYYVGSHWGFEDDGYICSSRMMRQAYNRRPDDFKRRILKRIYSNRKDLLLEEERWLNMIDPNKTTPKNTTEETRLNNVRYYNIKLGTQNHWWSDIDQSLTIGEKISAAKTGKKTTMTPEQLIERGKVISEAKKRKFAERGGISDAHRLALSKIKKKPHTVEWKEENSKRMKEQWADGSRSGKAHTEEWKNNISERLKGKKKPDGFADALKEANYKEYTIKFADGQTLCVRGLKKFAEERNIPYASLSKASQNGMKLKRHKIDSVALT